MPGRVPSRLPSVCSDSTSTRGASRAATAQTWLAALGGSLPGAALTWLAGRLYGRDPGSAFLAMAVVAALALPVGARLRGLALAGKHASL